nr:MAG TPA: tail assembly chaperone protein [Caudoviricetes sp.]DAX31728.1 MAG TPA: tail assembly chaperone protein [Caudoviricetes sp.]
MRKTMIKLPINGKEVEIFAPTVRVMKLAGLEKNDDERAIKLVVSCANMSNDEVESLDMLDFKAIEEVIKDFLQPAEKSV